MLGHSKAAGKAGLIFHRIHGKTIVWNLKAKLGTMNFSPAKSEETDGLSAICGQFFEVNFWETCHKTWTFAKPNDIM